jgi:hypothetical protein
MLNRFLVSSLIVGSLVSFAALAGEKAAPPAAAPAAPAAAAGPAKMTVTPVAELKWQPLDPKNPTGLQISPVTGDTFKGPGATFFLKLPAGTKSGLHGHTHDYFSVVISGAPAHGASEKDPGKPLAVGSTWFQPGKEMHHDTCTGDKECIVLLHYPKGGFDFLPGPVAAAPAAKK